MDPLALTILGATLLTGVLAVAGVYTLASARAHRRALLDRLQTTGGQAPPQPPGRKRHFAAVDRRLRRTSAGRRVARRLSATGLDVTPGEFTVYVLAGVIGLWLLAGSLLAPFFGPIAGLIGVFTAVAFLGRQRQKRIEAFINQLPELSRILANATSAGLAMRTALGMAAEELEAPAGDELTRVVDQLAVGRSMEEALDELAQRLPSRELVVLVTTLILSHRAGGTIVSSLRNLTATLEERKETRREVRTMLAEVNATAYTIPVLGLGAMLMMDSMSPGALERVTGSPLGQLAMVVAVSLFVVGFYVIRRLGRIDV
jgi:tight adherence protein B